MKSEILTVLAFLTTLACTEMATASESRTMTAFADAADAYIEETMRALPAVPGIAITVVRDGSPTYVRGFGKADVEAGEPMSPDTSLYVASNTKSFTALAAALLEHRGVLSLDRSVRSYLPCAPFPPETRPDEVTLRSLLTHTSGLVNDPLVFRTAFSGEHTPSELKRLLRATGVNEEAPLGKFSYTNTGYNIMGIVMEEVTGSRWQDLLRQVVFGPLAMRATTARRSELPAGTVVAAPYRATGIGERIRVPLEKTDGTLHAAGGILTTGNDLGKWLSAQLGVVKDPLPDEVIKATHELRVHTEGSVGPFGRDGYGLGWIHGSYAGDTLIYHLGTFPGANSVISFMPERKLGVAVFVNEDVVGIRTAILLTAFVYDWWRHEEGGKEPSLDRFRADIVSRLRDLDPLPAPVTFSAEEADPLVGIYESMDYGTLVVSRTPAGELQLTIGELHGVVTSFKDGSAQVPLRPGRPEEFRFVLEDGRAHRVAYGEWGSFDRRY